MKCSACKRPANADATRYGKLWCTHCVAAIEFEERLAQQNHLTVTDVFVDHHGRFAVLLADELGREPSHRDLEGVTLTETDVLRELNDAMTAFARSIVIVGGRVVCTSRNAAPTARQLLGIIAKYKPLLSAEERASTEHIQRVARLVVGEVH